MKKVKQLPARSEVKPADTLGSFEPVSRRRGLGNGVREVGEADRRLRQVPGQAGRGRRDAGRVPEVRPAISTAPASGWAPTPF